MTPLFLNVTKEERATIDRVLLRCKALTQYCETRATYLLAILNNQSMQAMIHTQIGMYGITASQDPTMILTTGQKIFRIHNPNILVKSSIETMGTELIELVEMPKQKKEARWELSFEEFKPEVYEQHCMDLMTFKQCKEQKTLPDGTIQYTDVPFAWYPCQLHASASPSAVYVTPTMQDGTIMLTDAVPNRQGVYFERARIAIDKVSHVGFLYPEFAPFLKIMVLYGQVGRFQTYQYIASWLG